MTDRKPTDTDHTGPGPSWRQVVLYLLCATLISLADPRPPTFLVGCLLVALAWALRIWSFGHLEKNQALVTTGPYAHCRNPAYLGSFSALAGVILAAGNMESTRGRIVWGFGLLLVSVFFSVYMPRKKRKEYTRLELLFGEPAKEYAANVPHFFPRLTPWDSGDDRRFSWARVTSNREWPWGLVLAGVLTAIWFVDLWSPLARLVG
jgi:protein-S-isoprenylcysteine O-methyltransferase Ste14